MGGFWTLMYKLFTNNLNTNSEKEPCGEGVWEDLKAKSREKVTHFKTVCRSSNRSACCKTTYIEYVDKKKEKNIWVAVCSLFKSLFSSFFQFDSFHCTFTFHWTVLVNDKTICISDTDFESLVLLHKGFLYFCIFGYNYNGSLNRSYRLLSCIAHSLWLPCRRGWTLSVAWYMTSHMSKHIGTTKSIH